MLTEVMHIWQTFTIHYEVMDSHADRELCRAKNADNQRIRHAYCVRQDEEHIKQHTSHKTPGVLEHESDLGGWITFPLK